MEATATEKKVISHLQIFETDLSIDMLDDGSIFLNLRGQKQKLNVNAVDSIIHAYNFMRSNFVPEVGETKDDNFILDQIIYLCCNHFNVSLADLRSGVRGDGLPRKRGVICFFARRCTTLSLNEIGRKLNRDHASIIHRCNKFIDHYETEKNFAAQVDQIANYLDGMLIPKAKDALKTLNPLWKKDQ
jgi:hypothetical protein